MTRFLVLEDEPLIAAMLVEWLEQEGHVVPALAYTTADALELVDRVDVDAAILDIQVRDGAAYPVANKLMQRCIPFLFATGWPKDAIDAEFQQVGIVRKPFEFEALSTTVLSLVGRNATFYDRAAPLAV